MEKKGIIMRKFVKGCLELDYNITDLEAYEKPKERKLNEVVEFCKKFDIEVVFGTSDDNTYLCEYRVEANTKQLCNSLFRELKDMLKEIFPHCKSSWQMGGSLLY